MSSKPNVLGVIPARGGSRRIPRKNIRLLAGKPLIAYTIEAAKKAKLLTDWVVSTDDNEILDVALNLGAFVVKRPEELSDATSGRVVANALDWYSYSHDMVVLLHPTSPIRDPRHIDQAIEMLWSSDAPALASVSCRKRCYVHNASIYAMKTEWFRRTHEHYCDQSIPFLMDKRHSIDIDDETDWQIAEALLERGNTASCLGSTTGPADKATELPVFRGVLRGRERWWEDGRLTR